MPSESMAELPVMADAINLVMAISVLPANAAKMTFLDDEVDILFYLVSVTKTPRLDLGL